MAFVIKNNTPVEQKREASLRAGPSGHPPPKSNKASSSGILGMERERGGLIIIIIAFLPRPYIQGGRAVKQFWTRHGAYNVDPIAHAECVYYESVTCPSYAYTHTANSSQGIVQRRRPNGSSGLIKLSYSPSDSFKRFSSLFFCHLRGGLKAVCALLLSLLRTGAKAGNNRSNEDDDISANNSSIGGFVATETKSP